MTEEDAKTFPPDKEVIDLRGGVRIVHDRRHLWVSVISGIPGSRNPYIGSGDASAQLLFQLLVEARRTNSLLESISARQRLDE